MNYFGNPSLIHAKYIPTILACQDVDTLLSQSGLLGLGFGTGFTNQSEKPVFGNNRRLFSKPLAQSVILKTDLNQFIGMVPIFWAFFGSTFCPIFALNRSFGSNKRWPMVDYNFRRSFDHRAATCMGCLLLIARFSLVKGNQSEKPVIWKTINWAKCVFW